MRTSFAQPASGIQRGNLLMFPPTNVKRIPLPDGDRGIAVTIDWMNKAARDGARDPQIRQLALQIAQGVGNKDSTGELNAVYAWVKQTIRFRGEWDETVQAPEVTLKFGAGDCDDHSVLMCALLGSIGYRCRFKTVAVRGEQQFTHVYAEALDPATGQWTALDTTVQQAYPGWEPPDKSREKEWKALGRLNGLGGSRRYRRLGDPGWGDQAAQIIDSTSPLVNAIADVNAQNFFRNNGALVNANFSSFPGGGTFQVSSTPSWVLPTAIGGVLLLGVFLFSSRRARR